MDDDKMATTMARKYILFKHFVEAMEELRIEFKRNSATNLRSWILPQIYENHT